MTAVPRTTPTRALGAARGRQRVLAVLVTAATLATGLIGVTPAIAAPSPAMVALQALAVHNAEPLRGYHRTLHFGAVYADVDMNGCDTRNDILRRDLTRKAMSGSCIVSRGNLLDKYTGRSVAFVRGTTTSKAVSIDNIVSTVNAWQTGAQSLTAAQRRTLANDPLNATATTRAAAGAKDGRSAARWLPSRVAHQCTYVARQISVKRLYGLWVTPEERAAMVAVLDTCPNQGLYSSRLMPTALPKSVPVVPPVDAPVAGDNGSPSRSTGRTVAGSAPLGTTAYAVPGGAVIVSPAGSDSAAGTITAPMRTVTAALTRVPTGGTIVLRGGSYHEDVTVFKAVTIQSYPGEIVWFDGSRPVTNWVASGGHWVSTGWTASFDSSPTFTFGAADSTEANWGFVNPARPMAAHPDQVFIDGVAQTQVKTLAQVTAGKFYVDYATDRLYLGSDPSGRAVRASDTVKALSVRSGNVVLRGFGVRRFAPSVPHMGAVTIERGTTTIENVIISDTATTGLFVQGAGSVIRDVTLLRNGLLGANANYADSLLVDGLHTRANNAEGFNTAPASGGFKFQRSRGVTIRDSAFVGNSGPGLWFDVSVYNGVVTGSDFLDNGGHGLIMEISSKFVIADNLVKGNTGDGLKVNDAANVDIWNNTIIGNGRSVNIVQDSRRASNLSSWGHDERQSLPDPGVTWVNKNISVVNNIIGDTSGNCLICVEDYSHAFSGVQMTGTMDGNVYRRPTDSNPSWAAIWSRGTTNVNPAVYTSFPAFQAAVPREAGSVLYSGTAVVDASGAPTATVSAQIASRAKALPTAIAAATGKTVGSKNLGAWFD